MSHSKESRAIYIAQPDLPPLETLLPHLHEIWKSRILTNNGPYHQRFEAALRDITNGLEVSLCANGTLALVIALQSLRVTGEVITTPYTFVATSHALLWNGITPVFVDIDPDSLNIDPNRIESAITPKTTAILAVHCYGRPCDVESIKRIADIYNLRVIYDAAHAFGVYDEEGSILRHGDLSITSFHATKVFTTFEGGAIFTQNGKLKQRIDYLKNFGFYDETTVIAPGINGKMNEFCAALGLVQLDHFSDYLNHRAHIDELYRSRLLGVSGIECLAPPPVQRYNYAYFPVLVGGQYPISRDALYEALKINGFYCRRYFYPPITEFSPYRGLPSASRDLLPNAYNVANRILCLPIHGGVTTEDALRLTDLIRNLSTKHHGMA